MSEGQREGERERENPTKGRERERGSGAHPKEGSSAPHVGLKLMKHEIMT